MTSYVGYRDKCRELEKEVEVLKAKIPDDRHVDTIEYLLTSAEAMIGAARILSEMRDDVAPNS